MHQLKCFIGSFIVICCIGFSGCASVPEEAVTLSYAVGEDIRQLHGGYRATVRFSFEQMRQNGLVVIDEIWIPAYLKSFVKEGELLDIAKEENWQDLEGWARAAIEDIDAKRKAFLDPLQQREEALLADIDAAFSRAIAANAAGTATPGPNWLQYMQNHQRMTSLSGLRALTYMTGGKASDQQRQT